uniref:Uncharacterized protein n=1 Tax=Sinocyclocheilus grahami TaxID=75366 RepID=A0A672KGG1_SINGR
VKVRIYLHHFVSTLLVGSNHRFDVCSAQNFRSEILLFPADSQNKHQHFTDVHGLPCIENLVCSADETPEPITTTITGNIPFWIKGNFLRNGPGKFEIGRSR